MCVCVCVSKGHLEDACAKVNMGANRHNRPKATNTHTRTHTHTHTHTHTRTHRLRQEVALASHSLSLLQERMACSESAQLAASVAALSTELADSKQAAEAARAKSKEVAAMSKVCGCGWVCDDVNARHDTFICVSQLLCIKLCKYVPVLFHTA